MAAWRKAMLERVLLLCLGLLSLALLLSFHQPYIFGRRIFAVAIFPAWVLVASAALWPKAPQRFRELTLVLGIMTLSVGSVAKLGFQAVNAFCAHLMLVVMVVLFMGQRAAWAVWALGLTSWSVIGLWAVHTHASGGADLFDPALGANWQRVIGIYALLSAATLFAVSYLTQRMKRALGRSEALYQALTQESTQRISALEEQRALEDKLRQAQKMEALGTLAGGVAHDFNNLLVVIINHAEMAAEQTDSAAIRDSLQQIQAAGERAASLTRQLLAFGRRQVAQRKALDINQRVDESLRMLRRLLPASIELSPELRAEQPEVWAGEVEIDQIIMNLCVNARDAMPSGGQLTIRTDNALRAGPTGEALRQHVCIHIEDSGVGMDESTRLRIFEPFFTTKSVGHGTGLGLSTVHGLVQQFGGFIEVDSAPGQGTRVRVYLPHHVGVAPEKSGVVAQRGRRGVETLLLADDDAAVREVLARRLQDNGYRVIACEDGEQALAAFRAHSREIALVISDAVMPKLGGRELYRAISSEFGELPFLVCSGYAAQTLEPEFFDHPLRAFLGKPFNDAALQETVRRLLDAAAKQNKAPAPERSLQTAIKPLAPG